MPTGTNTMPRSFTTDNHRKSPVPRAYIRYGAMNTGSIRMAGPKRLVWRATHDFDAAKAGAMQSASRRQNEPYIPTAAAESTGCLRVKNIAATAKNAQRKVNTAAGTTQLSLCCDAILPKRDKPYFTRTLKNRTGRVD